MSEQAPFSRPERIELASLAGYHEQYLYQCLTGRRSMDPKEAVRVERVTRGRLRRWHLCAKDWHEVWPELIGAEGAPAVPLLSEGARDAA